VQQRKDETLADRHARAVCAAAAWYRQCLQQPPPATAGAKAPAVVVLTADAAVQKRAAAEGLDAPSLEEYAQRFVKDQAVLDLIAWCAVAACCAVLMLRTLETQCCTLPNCMCEGYYVASKRTMQGCAAGGRGPARKAQAHLPRAPQLQRCQCWHPRRHAAAGHARSEQELPVRGQGGVHGRYQGVAYQSKTDCRTLFCMVASQDLCCCRGRLPSHDVLACMLLGMPSTAVPAAA
jgi:hypothetical protein